MPTYAYYLVTIISLVSGHVSAETREAKYPTEVACLTAALEAQPFLKSDQLARCDPGGPDVPTQMELEGGE